MWKTVEERQTIKVLIPEPSKALFFLLDLLRISTDKEFLRIQSIKESPVASTR
jgi:hypothetical protein